MMKTESQMYWLWLLSIEPLGSATLHRLLDHFKTPENIFHAAPSDYQRVAGLSEEKKACLIQNKDLTIGKKAMYYLEKHHIILITEEDPLYPKKFKWIYHPPVAFFAKGNLSLLERDLCIGIVGSRKASPGGLAQAAFFSSALSEAGVTIVSGFAKGIDTAAHEAALGRIGSTIAVLGCGINICYPESNKKLYRKLLDQGGLFVSEFFPDIPPRPYHFPLRNRIISGLSDGILVVEAAQKSGALITVRHALDQGKNVYAIPKDITLAQGAGCNALIKEGAKVVTGVEDILEDYVVAGVSKAKFHEIRQSAAGDLSGDERAVFEKIINGYHTVEQLEMVSGLPVDKLNAALSMLELEDYIAVKFGNISVVKM